ncbi:MAG TPA: hypothetical protein PKH77_05090 [Anaerolineae bacterium]|nr:hypothetical protein [Anaerolineae bacterium]
MGATVTDMTYPSARYYLERAFPLDRKGRLTSSDDLEKLRRALPNSPIVQDHVGDLLRFARQMLRDCEQSAPDAIPMAEIEFAGATLHFKWAE